MQHAHDTVGWLLSRVWRRANAETPNVDLNRLVDNPRHGTSRHNDAGIRTRDARRILRVLPNQAGGPGHGVEVEEDQRLGRLYTEPLKVWIDAIAVNVIDAQEPAVFRVRHDETPAVVLNTGMA